MYDTIIVGAGSAGCVLANRLSADPARKVLLLEAGGDQPINSRMPSDWVTLFNTDVDWGYHTVAQAGCRGRRIFWPRGKMMGGSGSMNAMIYIRGLPHDFEIWEKEMGCTGWGWDSVLPDFIASEHNANHGNSPLHGQGGTLHVESPGYRHAHEEAWVQAGVAAGYPENPDFNGDSQEGFGFFQFTIKDGIRSGTNRAYLTPVLERENLTVTKNVLITRVLIENGRAVGVEYLQNGRPVQARAAGEVVMAAGAIGTPQILMLSGLGAADELKAVQVDPLVDIPEVGKNLQDHINVAFSYYTREHTGIGAWDDAYLAATQKEWDDSGTGPRSVPWVAAGAHVRSRPDIEPDLQLYGAASPHRDYARFLASKAGMTMHSTLQRPESRGEITLRSADPIQHPAIDPKYFTSDPSGNDIRTLVEAIRIQRRIASAGPLAAILGDEMQPSAECQSDEELEQFVRGHCMTLYHPASTCRMGKDAGAVVDSDTFAVNGVEGLYIADASVFPRMISGNLNATVILVAERAAKAIAAKTA
jgi:choline dehydrogenase